jgi:hypothetical protein
VARPPRRQARSAIALVIVFLVVILGLAWKGLSGLANPFGPARSTATGRATTTPSATASPSPSTTGGALRVSRVTAFDPDGDKTENDSAADRAVDGDPSTSWTSATYRSARFGGLKPGVGLRLDLAGGPQQVHRVQVTVGGSGSTVQLRTVAGDTVSSTVLARQRKASGTVTLQPSSPVRADHLVVWFTRAAPTNGGYRVEVAEVSVS